MNATIDNMTIAQLKEQLTAKQIKFSSKMKREALVELLEKHREEAMDETAEFPEAKAVKPIADPIEQATAVIQEVISNWTELDTLTRSELLNEVSLSMGEEFVQENRKKLVGIAVEMIQQEMEKRTNAHPEVAEPEPQVEPVEPVAKPTKKTKKVKKQPEPEPQVEVAEPEPQVKPVEPEPPVEPVEPVEPVAKPKKTKKVKEQVEKINLEEMTLNQIREYMSANGMEKQLGKLNAILANTTKKTKKTTKPRQPSVFNLFMKEEMAALKETNPELNHRELFSTASSNWKTSAKNPKNNQV